MNLCKTIQNAFGVSEAKAKACMKAKFIPMSLAFDLDSVLEVEKITARMSINRKLQLLKQKQLSEKLQVVAQERRKRKMNKLLDHTLSPYYILWIEGNRDDLQDPTHSRAILFRKQFRVPYSFYLELVFLISSP